MARLKLSPKQAEQLLRQLGADVELVGDNDANKDVKFDDAIAAVDESRSRILRPVIESELKESLTSSIAGKFGGDLRAHLRRLSGGILKTSDLKDLTDEEALRKFLDTIAGQKDQSLEDLRNELKKQLDEHEEEKTKIITDKDREYQALRQKYLERDIDALLEKELTEIPRTGGNIKTQTQLAKAYVRERFKDHYDEDRKVIDLRDITNPEKPALKNNVVVQLREVLTDFANDAGIHKKDMRDEDPKKILQDHENGTPHQTSIIGGKADDVKDAVTNLEAQLASVQ